MKWGWLSSLGSSRDASTNCSNFSVFERLPGQSQAQRPQTRHLPAKKRHLLRLLIQPCDFKRLVCTAQVCPLLSEQLLPAALQLHSNSCSAEAPVAQTHKGHTGYMYQTEGRRYSPRPCVLLHLAPRRWAGESLRARWEAHMLGASQALPLVRPPLVLNTLDISICLEEPLGWRSLVRCCSGCLDLAPCTADKHSLNTRHQGCIGWGKLERAVSLSQFPLCVFLAGYLRSLGGGAAHPTSHTSAKRSRPTSYSFAENAAQSKGKCHIYDSVLLSQLPKKLPHPRGRISWRLATFHTGVSRLAWRPHQRMLLQSCNTAQAL